MNKKEKKVLIASFSIISVVTVSIIAFILLSTNDKLSLNNILNKRNNTDVAISENTDNEETSQTDNQKIEDLKKQLQDNEANNAAESSRENSQEAEPAAPLPQQEPQNNNNTTSQPPLVTGKVESANYEGFWNAAGRIDGVRSTWNFNMGNLTVNGKYHHTYQSQKFLDEYGYTVLTIHNPDNTSHLLLLKPTPYGMDGITAEGADYDNYLYNRIVPVHNQVIEFRK